MAYYDLGTYSSPITTSSKKAQKWFDRGLNWTFGYNHEEAVRCFEKAAKHDPECKIHPPRPVLWRFWDAGFIDDFELIWFFKAT